MLHCFIILFPQLRVLNTPLEKVKYVSSFRVKYELSRWLSHQCEETVVQRCSVKRCSYEISQNAQKNTCARVSFLVKLQAFRETLAQVFSCGFFEISKNSFLLRTPLVAASQCGCLSINAKSKSINETIDMFQKLR